MATTTAAKTPTESEMRAMYDQRVDETPEMVLALDRLASAAAHEQDIKARAQRAQDARKTGTHGELLEALASAPTTDDVVRAEAEVGIARAATAATRAAVKERRDEQF